MGVLLAADGNCCVHGHCMVRPLGTALESAARYYSYYRYVNGVKPGPYGIRQPFYFPFLPSYWIGHKAKKEEVQSLPEPN